MAGMNKFTQKAKRVLSIAQQEAETEQAREIGSEHLLLGLCIEAGTAASRVLEDLGVETDSVRVVLEEMRAKEEQEKIPSPALGEDMKNLLQQALAESVADKATTVGTEHLILAMSRDEKAWQCGFWQPWGSLLSKFSARLPASWKNTSACRMLPRKPKVPTTSRRAMLSADGGSPAEKKKRKARHPWWTNWQPT